MLAVLLLAGCPGTTLPPLTEAPGARRTAAAVPPVPRAKPVPPAAKAEAKDQGGLPAAAAGAMDVAAVGGARPPPRITPDTLVGLDQFQTRRLLGAPVATEEAPPAKVWRYAKGDCTLKVFFFMDMTSSQDFRALSYDMKSSENVPDVDNRCFAQLLAQAWDVPNE